MIACHVQDLWGWAQWGAAIDILEARLQLKSFIDVLQTILIYMEWTTQYTMVMLPGWIFIIHILTFNTANGIAMLYFWSTTQKSHFDSGSLYL